MKQICSLVVLSVFLLSMINAYAQHRGPVRLAGYPVQEEQQTEEITESQRAAIIKKLQANVARMKIKKTGKAARTAENTSNFIFPLRQAAGFNDAGFYEIGNYIDKDPSDQLQDYMCGTRTYNGHRGTDIGTFPFGWKKMDDNAVEIISAADGIIIGKDDGVDDKSCAGCTGYCPWNAVYVQNSDGTVCWYGHMKKGSLTSKAVGQAVSRGEYLGVVGSSGNSTGPHLHFEVYSNIQQNTLIDPWDGTCNVLGDKTYWQSQLPYHNPMVNKVMSSSDPPQLGGCYDNEKMFTQNDFIVGDTVYLPFFIRDYIPDRLVHVKLTDPSGYALFETDFNTGSNFFSGAYLYYYFTGLSALGKWKFSVAYGSNTVEHEFHINSALPVKLQRFSVSKIEAHARLLWETTEEVNADKFLIERSADGKTFSTIASKPVGRNASDGAVTSYEFDDTAPVAGLNYYRLKMLDLDGSFAYSKIVSILIGKETTLTIMPNPATKAVYVQGTNITSIELLDKSGKTRLIRTDLAGNGPYELDVQHLAAGLYILTTIDANGSKQSEKLMIR